MKLRIAYLMLAVGLVALVWVLVVLLATDADGARPGIWGAILGSVGMCLAALGLIRNGRRSTI